jgi:hypothetical protein
MKSNIHERQNVTEHLSPGEHSWMFVASWVDFRGGEPGRRHQLGTHRLTFGGGIAAKYIYHRRNS